MQGPHHLRIQVPLPYGLLLSWYYPVWLYCICLFHNQVLLHSELLSIHLLRSDIRISQISEAGFRHRLYRNIHPYFPVPFLNPMYNLPMHSPHCHLHHNGYSSCATFLCLRLPDFHPNLLMKTGQCCYLAVQDLQDLLYNYRFRLLLPSEQYSCLLLSSPDYSVPLPVLQVLLWLLRNLPFLIQEQILLFLKLLRMLCSCLLYKGLPLLSLHPSLPFPDLPYRFHPHILQFRIPSTP